MMKFIWIYIKAVIASLLPKKKCQCTSCKCTKPKVDFKLEQITSSVPLMGFSALDKDKTK